MTYQSCGSPQLGKFGVRVADMKKPRSSLQARKTCFRILYWGAFWSALKSPVRCGVEALCQTICRVGELT